MMKRTFTPNVGSLLVTLLLFLSGGLFAQNLTPVAGSTQTINVPSSGFTSFSDPGGPGGSQILCSGITIGTAAENYPNCDCITLVTVCHDVPGTPVEIDFTQFGVNALFDSLKVFDGNSIAGAELYSNSRTGAQTGDRCTGPGLVIATNPTGCITTLFSATASVEDAGFIANIIAGPVGDVDAGVTITSPDASTTATLQNVEVTLNNFGALPLNTATIDWEINGTPQTPFNYTGPAIASGASSAPIVLGTYTPAPGGFLKAWSSLPNGVADTIPANDTSTRSICIGMSGTYTIDPSQPTSLTNFTTMQGAVDSMGLCGIAGPVVFNFASGAAPFNEQVTIPEIDGASAVNTITFNGNGDTLQFTPNSSAKYILALDGADHIIIDSLYIRSLDATFGIGVILTNAADSNIIRKSVIDVGSVTSTTSTNSTALALTGSFTSGLVTGDNGSYNLFEGNTLIGGYYNLRINTGGRGYNEIRNNRLLDCYITAMYFGTNNDFLIVDGNDISRPTRTTGTTSAYGIYFSGNSSNTIVNANRVHNMAGGIANSLNDNHFGIYHTSCDATLGNENIVSNNLLYDFNNDGQINGIYNSGSDYVKYLHNSLDLTSTVATTTENTYGVYQTTTAEGIEFIGNIFNISRTGLSDHAAFYMNTSTTTFTANYNVVNVNSPTGANFYGVYGSPFATLTDWQIGTSQGANSYAVDPLFTSAATGDLTPGNPSFNNIVPNQGITVDFNGDPRGASTDPGAIEFSGVANDIGVFNILSPNRIVTVGAQNVDVEVRNFGTNTVNTYDVQWTVNGVPQTPTSSTTALAPSTSSSPITLGTFTPTGLDTIVAWTTNPNGGADAFQGNDTLSIFTCIGVEGVFTIDASLPTGGTNFASFTDAIAAMTNCGITGPVTFNVVPGSGPYNEQVIIPAISGMSAANPITFNGSGDTLQFDAISGARHIILLDGAQYVTIDDLVIVSLSGTYGYGIQLSNGADHNTITNNVIDLNGVTSVTAANSAGIVFSGSSTSPTSTAGSAGSYNLVEGNTIKGGYYGLTVYGPSGGTSTVDNQILNNIIEDYYSYGVYLGYNSNTVVRGNDMSRPTRLSVTTHYGVYATTSTIGSLIDANRIHNTHGAATSLTSSTYGIYITSTDVDSNMVNVISNNLIYDFGNNSATYGIYNSSSDGNHVYNNTIVFDNQNFASTSTMYCFYQTTAAENVVVKNNIFYNTSTGTGTKYGSYMSTSTSDIVFDNNVYYINSATGTNNIGYYSGAQETLADWRAANNGTYDLNGIVRDPRFADPATFDYTPAAAAINNIAEPLALVPFDFFGTARGATPDPGAIEFTPAADDAATIELLSPAAPFAPGVLPVEVVIQNLGIATLTEVNIYAVIDDGVSSTTLPVFVHSPISVPSLARDTVTIGTFNFTSPSYTITVFTSDPNGAPDANTLNDTLRVDVCLALPAGNYTINSALPTGSGNYQTFNDAAAALTCGILGDVVFTVAPGSGPYSEQVTFGEVPGAGPTATVTFDGSGETLTHDGSVKFATIVLSGTDYMTFTNFTIESTSTAQGFGVQLNNAADHNTIKNTTVSLNTASTNAVNVGINASASELLAVTEGNNANYLWVDSCTIIGGYRGVALEGSATELLKGNRITNSTFLLQDEGGIYVDDQDSLIVSGNTVDSLRDQTNADGIYLLDINGYFEVEHNLVNAPGWGIYFNDGNTADSTRRAKVTNNMVRSSGTFGMYFVSCSHVDIFHNTSVGNSPIYFATNSARMDIRNNIFYSPSDYAFENAVSESTFNPVAIDYNVYYSGSVSLLIKYGGTTTSFDYAPLGDWQTAFPMFNMNSLEGDPQFVDLFTDLHVLGVLANDVGDNSVGVAVDIDGESRPIAPSTVVDIGADEYTPYENDIKLVDLISPILGGCGDSNAVVSVVIYNFGTVAQSGFDIQVDVTGTATQTFSTTYAGPIAPHTYDTVVLGTLNTYAGGLFNFFAQHLLATDQYDVNDTLSKEVPVLAIPAPPAAVGDTGCVGEFLELSADLTGFFDLEWYDDASLTNSVGSGELFFTPALSTSTTYYVIGKQGSFDRAGKPAPGGSSAFNSALNYGIEFESTETLVIDSITVYPSGPGTVTLQYYDLNNGNQVVATAAPATVTGNSNTPFQIYVGWTVTPGRYQVGLESSTVTLVRDLSGASFPYPATNFGFVVTHSKTSFTNISATTNYWFYDFKLRRPGCDSPPTAVEAFISAPVSDAGANDTICAGESATLEAQNGDSWLWTGGLNTQTITVSPLTTTTYSLTITDALGCTGTPDQTTVVVNALPNVVASNDTAICDGETASLAAIGATSYEWSNAATTPIINVVTAGTYTVTGTDANGCVNVDTSVVTVRALPSGNASADVAICEGGSTQLEATGGVSYVWSTTETSSDITVSPTTTTDYTVATTDQFGCVGEDTVTVTVNALPTISITVSDTICIRETARVLTATPAGGTFTGPGVSGGVFDASVVGVGTYNITYNYTDGNGCSNSAVKAIVVDGSPNCTVDTTGIGAIAGLEIGGVYPNPFQDKVTIEFTATSNEPVTINMYDLLGQVIFTAQVDVAYGLNTYTIDTDRTLAEGFYVVELRKGGQSYLEKLLRVR